MNLSVLCPASASDIFGVLHEYSTGGFDGYGLAVGCDVVCVSVHREGRAYRKAGSFKFHPLTDSDFLITGEHSSSTFARFVPRFKSGGDVAGEGPEAALGPVVSYPLLLSCFAEKW